MLEYSLIGKLYIFWQNSLIYRLLGAIYHVFSNAFRYSLFRRIMVHESKLQQIYENCLLSKIIDWIIDFVILILGKIEKYFAVAFKNSKIVNLFKGSLFINFEFIFAVFAGGMYIVPHNLWSNMFAVAGTFLLVAVYALLCAANQRRVLYPKKLGLPLLIFALLTPVTMLFTVEKGNSLRVLIFVFAALALMWITASNLDTEEKLKNLLCWIYIAVIFTALFAIFQRAVGIEANPTFIDQELNPNLPARVYSTVDNPNNYAELLVLFMPLAAVYAMNIKNVLRRFICCILLALPMLALVMTYSRSGWLSIALTVFIFVYYTNKKLVPWMFVAAILCVPFLPASVMTRLGNLFNVADSSANFRLELWESCLRLLSKGNRWLTGIGLGPYTYNQNMLQVTTIKIAQSMPHTQMLYLELIMEWGIFGFITYMWFIITKIISGACQINKSRSKYVNGALISSVASLIGIAILSVFEYIWFYPRIMFAYFVVVGIMIACTRMARRENGK